MRRFSTGADHPPKALSLDLFGTIVFFDADRLPRRRVAGVDRVMTVEGLDELLAAAAPSVGLPEFLDAVADASASIGREKQANLREVPTAERYLRALSTLGVGAEAERVSELMAKRHMDALAAAVTCPTDRGALVGELASRYPLALVSNFDHGDTARRLLDRFGLTSRFRCVVISAEVGMVKPAAEIFRLACRGLGFAPEHVLHVGDSSAADVDGASAAGLRSLWIGSGACDRAIGSITDLAELPRWLTDRYGS